MFLPAREADRLERVRIEKPCALRWEEMRGDDRARFCDECGKNVHNFSALTRAQAARLVADSRGKLCARYVTGADGKIQTLEAPRDPRNVTARAPLAAGAAFTALLGVLTGASTAQAQEQCKPAPATARTSNRTGSAKHVITKATEAALEGTVYDINCAAVADAGVQLVSQTTGRMRKARTTVEGAFRFAQLEPGSYSLKVSSLGFYDFEEQNLLLEAGQRTRMNVQMHVPPLLGEVVYIPSRRERVLHFLSLPLRGIRKIFTGGSL